MIELLAFGTLWFWLFLGLTFALMVALTEYEKPGWALTSIVAGLVLLNWANNGSVLSWIIHHPIYVAGGFVGYFVIGVLNARYKWGKLVYQCRQKLDDLVSEFLKERKLEGKTIPAELEDEWADHFSHFKSHNYYDVSSGTPTAEKPLLKTHKALVTTWIAYWPWSVFWTLLNDPIRWAVEEIVNAIKGWFQGVADDAFKDAPKTKKKN